jgi:hypothetical protein
MTILVSNKPGKTTLQPKGLNDTQAIRRHEARFARIVSKLPHLDLDHRVSMFKSIDYNPVDFFFDRIQSSPWHLHLFSHWFWDLLDGSIWQGEKADLSVLFSRSL